MEKFVAYTMTAKLLLSTMCVCFFDFLAQYLSLDIYVADLMLKNKR